MALPPDEAIDIGMNKGSQQGGPTGNETRIGAHIDRVDPTERPAQTAPPALATVQVTVVSSPE